MLFNLMLGEQNMNFIFEQQKDYEDTCLGLLAIEFGTTTLQTLSWLDIVIAIGLDRLML